MLSKTIQPYMLTLALPILAFFTGCMATPGNGELLSGSSQTVTFEGFVPLPGAPISVSAWNPKTNTWEVIATTSSETWQWVYGGQQWYVWQTHAVIPSRFWTKNPSDQYAHAKLIANWPEGSLATFQAGYGKTWDFFQYPTALEAYEAHGAGTSITVYAK